MDFSVESIKVDLKELSEKEFLVKYLLKSDNWYFSEYQSRSDVDSIAQMDILKEIINKYLGVAFHNILMVGSGKVGCSLSPNKNFKLFDEGDEDSDIDIAIISSKLFDHYWEKIRMEFSIKYLYQYNEITSSIFRGFINEQHFKTIDEVRPEWNAKIDNVNKSIQKNIFIYHPVNYRIYKSWEDLEAYHISGIRKLKGKI